MMLVKARPWWLPSAIGLGLSAVVFVAVSVLWFLPMRSIHRVRSFAGDPEKLESAAASLVASFDKAVPTSAIGLRRRGIRALAAVGALCDVQQFERAGRVLDLVEPNSMTGDLRAMLYLSRSTVALHFGARDAAFAALKEAAAASTGRVQLIGDIIVINSALLDAMDGRGSEALGRLTELGEPKEPGLRRAWHVARAHAFASNGDDDAARAAVEDVVRLAPEALARSAHLPGPAQRLFEEAYQSRQIIASSSQSFGP
jgi:hypothetical protein